MITKRWGRSMVFVDCSTVNVNGPGLGLGGPNFGPGWAGLARTRVARLGCPRGALGLLLGYGLWVWLMVG
jgi:hypothetical protein